MHCIIMYVLCTWQIEVTVNCSMVTCALVRLNRYAYISYTRYNLVPILDPEEIPAWTTSTLQYNTKEAIIDAYQCHGRNPPSVLNHVIQCCRFLFFVD